MGRRWGDRAGAAVQLVAAAGSPSVVVGLVLGKDAASSAASPATSTGCSATLDRHRSVIQVAPRLPQYTCAGGTARAPASHLAILPRNRSYPSADARTLVVWEFLGEFMALRLDTALRCHGLPRHSARPDGESRSLPAAATAGPAALSTAEPGGMRAHSGARSSPGSWSRPW